MGIWSNFGVLFIKGYCYDVIVYYNIFKKSE